MHCRKIHEKIKKILLSATVLTIAFSLNSVTVSAANINILPNAGVASILEPILSEEEYIRFAKEIPSFSWGYTNLGLCNVDEGNLNVRENPDVSGKLVGKLPKNAGCEIIGKEKDWAHIKSGEVEGYVKLEYLLTGTEAKMKAKEVAYTAAVANVNHLNVRKKPNTNSSILTQILEGEQLEYVSKENGWVQVSIDGETAYVSEQYVDIKEVLDTAITMKELTYGSDISDKRVELVEYAKQFLGNPYVWGGTSLTKGADCSGFVLSVYKKFGVTLTHYSGAQAKEGKEIEFSDLKPADLVFYTDENGTINHVAIYIGDSQVIHASSPKSGIKISKYNYRTPVKAVRIFND